VAVGDSIEREASLVTIESDKASMEIPSPVGGVIREIAVSVGDRVSEGALIARVALSDAATIAEPIGETAAEPIAEPAASARESLEPSARDEPPEAAAGSARAAYRDSSQHALRPARASATQTSSQPRPAAPALAPPAARTAHAGPSVRRFARELGANLDLIRGSGRKGRILRQDVQDFVRRALREAGGPAPIENALRLEPAPAINFAEFGEVEIEKLNNIRKIAAKSLHRSWLTVPHVTQFDEADITELEEYRKSQQTESEKRGVKLTALTFVMKAVVSTLKEFPRFCSSLDASGENLILKRYFHIGIAVDTPNGLIVPVVRDVDRKGLFDLAAELEAVSERARNRKLSPADLAGGCFSISSLGGIGGTAFTPIVNAPEVAILGVSRHAMKPIYRDGQFIPRLMLPLSLSYDHRVIDGAAAARFTSKLKDVLSDVRNLIL
jgi:pyruvate dehydrogenase E2 component (dihydrolipoamide acetyltransferase)